MTTTHTTPSAGALRAVKRIDQSNHFVREYEECARIIDEECGTAELLTVCKQVLAALDASTAAMYITGLNCNALRAAIAKHESAEATRPGG